MADRAISVEGLGKRYRRGQLLHRQSFREALNESLIDLLPRFGRPRRQPVLPPGVRVPEDFWALHDVSFQVERGTMVGIIDHNGSGKSTLLKILSRTTEPTEGRVEFWGKVAALLEVGTGFHPEFTGRENVFLNGAFLGMSRADIEARFDDIVAFAGIGDFIDTPVKWYSSGMYVRLAFSVASFVDPDILLVDEVLAVGDVAFQKKCFAKLREKAENRKTIVLVSHATDIVERLCDWCIVLDHGRMVRQGEPKDCVRFYIDSQNR